MNNCSTTIMLVISRKPEQSFTINKVIEVKLIRLHAGRAVLGITAPSDYAIVRDDAIVQERKSDNDRNK